MVAGTKAEFIVTLDEAMLPLNFLNGQTSHCCQPKRISERSKNPPVATSASQFPRQIMFAASFSWRAQTAFYHIPEKSKVNAGLFIKHVLEPIVYQDLPRLYGRNAKKVVWHMDSASSQRQPGWKRTKWSTLLKKNGCRIRLKYLQWTFSPMGILKIECRRDSLLPCAACWNARKTSGQQFLCRSSEMLFLRGRNEFWWFTRPMVML